MRLLRRLSLVLILAMSLLPQPSFAADITIVAQGTGSFTDTFWPGGLKCNLPVTLTFQVTGANFVLNETDGAATPASNTSNDAKVECAGWVLGGDVASNQFPKLRQCVPATMFGPSFGTYFEPYTFTGTGTTTPNNPYIVKQVTTSCAGKTLTDKMTFYKSAVNGTFSYVHELMSGTTTTFKLTATLMRMQ